MKLEIDPDSELNLNLSDEVTVISLKKIDRGNRIEVDFDKARPLYLSLDLVYKFQLNKGVKLPYSKLRMILQEQQNFDAKQQALRYISARPYSEKEIRVKLSKKNYASQEIEVAIAFLKELDYLNDYRYFENLAQWLIEKKYYGKSRLSLELAKKGANKNIRDQICSKLFGEDTELDAARKLIEKKKETINRKDPSKQKTYIYNILSRNGISSSVIRQVLEDYKFPNIDETF